MPDEIGNIAQSAEALRASRLPLRRVTRIRWRLRLRVISSEMEHFTARKSRSTNDQTCDFEPKSKESLPDNTTADPKKEGGKARLLEGAPGFFNGTERAKRFPCERQERLRGKRTLSG